MVPEHWLLGEDLQDKIRAAGYDSPTVEGIAIDLHDLMQAAARISEKLAPAIVAETDPAKLLALLEELRFEFNHVAWHAQSATAFLGDALAQMERGIHSA